MDKYYELMSYDEFDFYYIFADAKTYEVLFLNQPLCNFLRVKFNNCIGKKCYEMLYNRNDICPTCVNEELITSDFKCMESVINLNKIDINCNITIMEIDGKLVRVTKMPIHSNKLDTVNNISVNDILADLIRNIKNDNFEIHLQPKFEIIKGFDSYSTKLIGAEALVRRYDPNLNEIILPDEFIPLYENMSIVRHIDLFVLEQTCKFLSLILQKEPSFYIGHISVNFNGATLLEFSCINTIKSICDKYNVPYHYIMIEISKDKFTEVYKNFIAMSLNNLSKLGFLIALSNINLSNLSIFAIDDVQFDEIKISRNLVLDNNISLNDDATNIFEGVLQSYSSFSNKNNQQIVAVGVQNDSQRDFFYNINCKFQQGFLHCEPLSLENFTLQFIS